MAQEADHGLILGQAVNSQAFRRTQQSGNMGVSFPLD